MKYEIFEYKNEGYSPLMTYNSWRVAQLNYTEELLVDNISYFECHMETDEVFILLSGEATLFFADVDNDQIMGVESLFLEPNKVYNIKKGVYHTHTLSKDARLLIVEEDSTTVDNSPRIKINNDIRSKLKACHIKGE